MITPWFFGGATNEGYPLRRIHNPREPPFHLSPLSDGDALPGTTPNPPERALIPKKATLSFREYFILVLIWLIRG